MVAFKDSFVAAVVGAGLLLSDALVQAASRVAPKGAEVLTVAVLGGKKYRALPLLKMLRQLWRATSLTCVF